MADGKTVIGQKISEIPSSEGPLQRNDLFIFSHFNEEKQGVKYYDSSKSIMYDRLSSSLYDDVMPNLLDDQYFIDRVYSTLSARLLNDQNFIDQMAKELSGKIGPVTTYGILKYKSNYPY